MLRLKEFLKYKEGGDIESEWEKMSPFERGNYIMNYFLNRGYTPIQSAAIVGNLMRENDTFGTSRKNMQGSGAIGIAQWLGGRKTNLMNEYADGWYKINNQLDYLHKEIYNNHKGAWTNNVGGKNAFFNAKTVDEATRIFRKDFERPGNQEARDDIRIKNAYSFLGNDTFKGEITSPPNNNDYLNNLNEAFNSQWWKNQPDSVKKQYQSYLPIPDSQVYMEEQRLMAQEREQQELNKKRVEEENLQIQNALMLKQREKQRMLSMIPQVKSVTQQGGISLGI